MKKVPLLLVAVLWSQNILSLRQLKRFSRLLIASCLLNVAYTGWQYTYGSGAKLTDISPSSRLARAGVQEGDVISEIGDHRIRDRDQLIRALLDTNVKAEVRLTVLRGMPREKIYFDLDRKATSETLAEIMSRQISVTRGRPLRAQGFYDHFVTYADVLVQIALLAFALFISNPGGRLGGKIFFGLAAFGMMCALWLTLTRAAIVSFLFGFALVVGLLCRGSARLVAVAFAVAALIVGGILIQRGRGLTWLNLESPEAQYRLLMWKDGLRLIREYPWLGIGMGSLKDHWKEWNIAAYKKFPLQSHFHSSPLQIAVERGLLTLAAWLWFLVCYLRIFVRLLRSPAGSDLTLRTFAVGLCAASFAFLLGSLTDYSWGDSEVVIIFWTFVGWVLSMERIVGPRKQPSRSGADPQVGRPPALGVCG